MLFGTAVTSALAFGALTELVRRKKISAIDQRARKKILEFSPGVARFVGKLGSPLGKWYGHAPLAFVAARKLVAAQRTAGALTVAGTSIAAALLSKPIDRLIAKRRPPPGNEPTKQSYPSGHAFESSAVVVSAGYVLTRERLVEPWALVPFGLASLVAGGGRLALDRHWLSDLVGGYLAGIALGAAAAGTYELGVGSDFRHRTLRT